MTFTCNLCGTGNDVQPADVHREGGFCTTCGSFVRARALVYLLGRTLFQSVDPVSQWPTRPDVHVVGVSDWPAFSTFLGRKVSYINTQFDEALRESGEFLDITAPSERFRGFADAVMCSDVLEHIPVPVERAFSGLFEVLTPGGSLVLTVPYTLGDTIEHFPEMHNWALAERDGTRVLFNATTDGRLQEFANLTFHGGGDAVLEMRVFGLRDVLAHLARAGFVDIAVAEDPVPAYGITTEPRWSLPITAIKPARA